jgi:hypothetical protein
MPQLRTAILLVAMTASCLPDEGELIVTVEQPLATECWAFDALNETGPLHDQGQSFTATIDGAVVRIDLALYSGAGNQISLALYEGEGFAGRMMHSELVTSARENGAIPLQYYPLAQAVAVRAQQVYTIGLAFDAQPGNGGHCGVPSNPYAGGVRYDNGLPIAQADNQFRVYISP